MVCDVCVRMFCHVCVSWCVPWVYGAGGGADRPVLAADTDQRCATAYLSACKEREREGGREGGRVSARAREREMQAQTQASSMSVCMNMVLGVSIERILAPHPCASSMHAFYVPLCLCL